MAAVKVRTDGERIVEPVVNGFPVTNVQGIDLRLREGQVPQVKIEVAGKDLDIDVEEADVSIQPVVESEAIADVKLRRDLSAVVENVSLLWDEEVGCYMLSREQLATLRQLAEVDDD